ncbi:MAG: hypothetical protein HYU97_09265 [Deltaproteobacteria bacterium]|nr:hypothetical protein [Deltaproteobacteria bacterium]
MVAGLNATGPNGAPSVVPNQDSLVYWTDALRLRLVFNLYVAASRTDPTAELPPILQKFKAVLGQSRNLSEAYFFLGEGGKGALLGLVGKQCFRVFTEIGSNSTPEINVNALTALAHDLVLGGQRDRAAAILQVAESLAKGLPGVVPGLANEGRRALQDAVLGVGNSLPRLVLNASVLPQEVFTPEVVVPLFLTGMGSLGVRWGTMKVLDKFTKVRGFGAKATTAGVVFGAQAPMYTAFHHGMLKFEDKPTGNFGAEMASAYVDFAWFGVAGAVGKGLVARGLQFPVTPSRLWWGMPQMDWGSRLALAGVPLALQYVALGYSQDTQNAFGLAPTLQAGATDGVDRLTALARMHLGLSGANLAGRVVLPKVGINLYERNLKLEQRLEFYGKIPLPPAYPFDGAFNAPSITGIPETWEHTFGSGLRTARQVRTTRDMVNAMVEDGIKPMFGESNMDAVFGYGSFQEFGGRTGLKTEALIRKSDIGNVPDFLVVGNAEAAAKHLAKVWHFSDAERASLLKHMAYKPTGARQGAVFFNTDLLIPEMGPVPLKVSFVSRELFHAIEVVGDKARARVEYSGARLADATGDALLWVSPRNHENPRLEIRIRGQLNDVRATMMDLAYKAIAPGVGSYLRPSRWAALAQPQYTGEDLARRFFVQKYRPTLFRVMENGPGSFNKGHQSFDGVPAKGDKPAKPGRKDIVRPIMQDTLIEFARTHPHLQLTYQGRRIEPHEITVGNVYDVVFQEPSGGFKTAWQHSKAYWGEAPRFAALNARSTGSLISHAWPVDKMSRRFYNLTHAEYAGRKARKFTGIEKAKTPQDLKPWQRFVVGLLVAPRNLPGPIGNLARAPKAILAGIGLSKIQLDSVGYPVYYSTLLPLANKLFAEGKITEAQHRVLTDWIVGDPRLTQLKDHALLETLRPTLNKADDLDARGAAQAFLKALPYGMLEPESQSFISQHVTGE